MQLLRWLLVAGALSTALAGVSQETKDELERRRMDVQPILDKVREVHRLHPRLVTDPDLSWLVKEALGGVEFNRLFDYDVYMRSVDDNPQKRVIDMSLRATEPFKPPQVRCSRRLLGHVPSSRAFSPRLPARRSRGFRTAILVVRAGESRRENLSFWYLDGGGDDSRATP